MFSLFISNHHLNHFHLARVKITQNGFGELLKLYA